MSAECAVTHGPERTRCTLPRGHEGQHKGGGWVWWHGNGEECSTDCELCDCMAADQYDRARGYDRPREVRAAEARAVIAEAPVIER